MQTDGNLISKGQGEGEAIMIQPFLPDQTPFNQMNQALMQQTAQKAQVGMANQREAEGSRDAWLKRLSNANYNRLDEPAIRKLQDKIIESITSYKTGDPKTSIEQQLAAFEYLTKTSQESLKGDNEIQSDMIKNADKVWYKGQDEWTKAQVENTAETYEDAVKAIARRDAARKLVVQGGEKINEPIPYLDKIVQKASMTSNEPIQYHGVDGTLITKYETFTDPKKLKETVEFDFKNNPEAQRVFGSAEEMYNQADKRAVYKKSVNVKGKTNDAKANPNANLGGGTSVAGNFTFNPSVKYNFYDKKAQTEAYKKYYSGIEAASANESASQKKKILNTSMDEESFNRKYPYTYLEDAIPFGVKGTAENSPRKFIVEGEKEQITGVSTLYSPSRKAFIVQTNNGVYLAPVEKNTNYISDNGATLDEFYSAVGQTQGGNVVKTGSDGSVISKEKDSSKKEIPQKYKDAIDWLNKNPKGKQSDEIRKLLKSKGYL